MRLEPWPSSLSYQRYNQQSIFRLLIRSIIKVNKIIFVLAAPHIFCVIFKNKKSEICCESVIHTFLHRLFVLKQYFYSKKSKSIMRLEPWPSSLSYQRYNQQSIFRLLFRSIIKVNKIIFVLAAPHIFCVIFKTKKSEICCESVIHTFLHRLFVLKRDFSVTVQYPCNLFTFSNSLLNLNFHIFTHKVQ
jgi:hypothetical protein